MIRIDRKIARAALKLTKNYEDEIFYSSGNCTFMLVAASGPPRKSVTVSVPAVDILPAITRLAEKEYLKILIQTEDEIYFSVQPRLRHWFAFWLDAFTRTYIAGFISGVAATVVAGLIVHYFTEVF